MTRLFRSVVKQWRVLLGIAISVFFLAWALGQVEDFDLVGQALSRANYIFVIPALGVYFFGVWLRAWRWRFLLRPMADIPTNRLFPIVVIGYMANDVLPARLGEIVRSYVIGEREGLSKAAAFSTIAVERLFDGLTMLAFMAIVGIFVPLDETLRSILLFASAIFVGALAVVLAIALWQERALALIDRLLRILPLSLGQKISAIIGKFLVGLAALRSFRLSLSILLLSFGAWIAETTMYFIIALGFGFSISPGAYLLTTAVANLGAMIPSSPGYVGTFETFALASLRLFGLSADVALSYILVVHVALLVPVTLLGFFYLWRYGLSLNKLRQSKESLAPEADARAS